jgi:4-amino-4-deoxy-L-arabinose transferase-like glycosyltransferase
MGTLAPTGSVPGMTDTEATGQPNDDPSADPSADVAEDVVETIADPAPQADEHGGPAALLDKVGDALVRALRAVINVIRRYPWVLVGLGAFTLTALLLLPGHWWGDDWALYVRQAEGLVHHRTGDVVRDARFTYDNSIGPDFTPRVYPWGTAMLLAVPIAFLGRNIAAMKLTEAFAMGVAAMAFYSMARRRMSGTAALAGAVCISISYPLISWADYIGSDIPYLAVVALCLAVFARWFATDNLGRRQVMLLGALGAAAFAFRQEGLTVLAVLLAAAAWYRLSASRSRETIRSTAVDLALGVGVFTVITAVLQVLLPYQLLPSYKGSGLGRIRPSVSPYLRAAGNQFSIYNKSHHRVEALDQPWLGWTILVLGTFFVFIGLARMFRRHDALDVVILLMCGAHAYTAFTALHANDRYLFVTVAIVTLIGAQGIDAIAGGFASKMQVHKWAVVVLLAAPVVWVQVPRYTTAAKNANKAREIDRPWNGPYEPNSMEMFVAVYENTGAADVVGFKKARAMTLFTNRTAVQTPWPTAVPPVADWYVSEKDKNGNYPEPSQSICECTATEVWHNAKYMLYELHHDG